MERQVMVDARHPLVAPLFAAFQDRMYLYLEMEYCPGGSLDNFLRYVLYMRGSSSRRVHKSHEMQWKDSVVEGSRPRQTFGP